MREIQTTIGLDVDAIPRKGAFQVTARHDCKDAAGSLDSSRRPVDMAHSLGPLGVDFVPRKKIAPSQVTTRPDYRDAAGSLDSSQRRLDMAPALLKTSIDVQVRRMHTAPPPVRPDKGWTYAMSDCFANIPLLGRGSGLNPSPSRSRSSSHRAQASRDRSESVDSELSRSESTKARSCSRGRSFDPPQEPAWSCSRSRLVCVPRLDLDDLGDKGQRVERAEVVTAQDLASSPFGLWSVKGCHKQQDDQASLTTTAASQGGSLTASVASQGCSRSASAQLRRPSEISNSIVLIATSDEGYASHRRRAASHLEQHVKNQVLKEQKKVAAAIGSPLPRQPQKLRRCFCHGVPFESDCGKAGLSRRS